MLHGIGAYSFPPDAGPCLAGSFYLDVATGRFDWSEEVFQIHGYIPGEAVPTIDLLMAHKHPEDREPIRRLISDLCSRGGQQAMFHRVIDSDGRERHVFTAAEACGDSGNVTGQNTNIKLATVAAQLVEAAIQGGATATLSGWAELSGREDRAGQEDPAAQPAALS